MPLITSMLENVLIFSILYPKYFIDPKVEDDLNSEPLPKNGTRLAPTEIEPGEAQCTLVISAFIFQGRLSVSAATSRAGYVVVHKMRDNTSMCQTYEVIHLICGLLPPLFQGTL